MTAPPARHQSLTRNTGQTGKPKRSSPPQTTHHEREARQAATRALHGQHTPALQLTPAPAALRLSSSAGIPLPAPLRLQLESAYQADLDAVRLHTDTHATRLAEDYHARAFASGRDIFFAAGAYQPLSRQGQHLIAHEVAHVLQQTTAISPQGLLQATPRYGSADVQRQDEEDQPEPPSLAFSVLRDAYREHAQANDSTTNREQLDNIISIVQTAIGGADVRLSIALQEREQVVALATDVRAGVHDGLPEIALSFLLDCLMMMGQNRAAAHILTESPQIQTVTSPTPFLEFTRNSPQLGPNWAFGIFTQISAIKDVFPGAFLGALWRYLTRPASRPSSSFQIQAAVTTHRESLQFQLQNNFLKENIRQVNAWLLLEEVNNQLADDLDRLETALADHPPAERRLLAARQYKYQVQQRYSNHDLNIYSTLAPLMIDRLDAAITFWEQSSQLLETLNVSVEQFIADFRSPADDSTEPPDINLPPIPEAVRDDRHFMAFLNDTKTRILELLGGESLETLDPDDYQEKITAFEGALQKHRRTLSDQLERIFPQAHRNNEEKREIAVWYGWAQIFMDVLQQHFERYNKWEEYLLMLRYNGLQDVRLRHRALLARWYGYIVGLLLNDTGFLDKLNEIISGQDVERSYLAFAGVWQQDSSSSVDTMPRDFPARPIEDLGLTPHQLVRVYQLLRLIVRNEQLLLYLSLAEENLDPSTLNLISKSIARANTIMPMPQRWVPTEYVIVWYPNDAHVPERRDVGRLIENHPRFPELLDMVEPIFQNYLLRNDARLYDAFVWFLPNLTRVSRYLYQNEAVRTLLRSRFSNVDGITPDNILDYLSAIDLQDVIASEFADAFASEISQQSTEQLNLRFRLLRRATTHDRRVIENVIRTHLLTYAESPHVGNMHRMFETMDLLSGFRAHVQPQNPDDPHLDDRDEQEAALILNCASAMKAALHRDAPFLFPGHITESNFTLITGFFEFINKALAFVASSNARARLQVVLHSTEDVDQVLSNAAHLRTLRELLKTRIREIQRQTGFQTTHDHSALRQTGSTTIIGDISGDPDTGYRTIGVNDPFVIDGIEYVIIEIYTGFIYHPPYGRNTAAETDAILTDLQGNEIPDTVPLFKYARSNMVQSETTPTEEGDTSEEGIVVTPSHQEDLILLQDAVQRAIIYRGLQELAELIEAGAQITVELGAVLLPGGQVALTIAQIVRFVAVELPRLRQTLLKNPQVIIEEIGQFIAPENREHAIEQLWLFLLGDGNLPFESQLSALSEGEDNAHQRRPRTRIARIMRFAKHLGIRILDSFLDFRNASQGSMVRARRILVRYPILERLLQTIPTLLALAGTVNRRDLENVAELLGMATDPENLTEKLQNTMHEFLTGLNELTLPEEIIPMDMIIAVLMDRFVRSMGVKGRIIAELSDALGATDEIAEAIADELRSQGADPNILWQSSMREHLQSMLDDAKIEIISGINGILRQFFGETFILSTAGLPESRAHFENTAPAVEGLPRHKQKNEDPENPPLTFPGIDPKRGRPLRPTMRALYEKSFGHDFSHVRIHDDHQAAQLNAWFHTRALTSGSHIFFAGDIHVDSARTEMILRHELAHVLQQTGSRPLDLPADDQPVLGQPRRGLIVNSRRELAAQNMARRSQYRSGDDPIRVEEEGGIGFMPSTTSIAAAVINNLTEGRAVEDFVQRIEGRLTVPAPISRHAGFQEAARDGLRIWQQIRTELGKTTPPGNSMHDHREPFNTSDEGNYKGGRKAIASFFSGSSQSANLSNQQIRALTSYSVRTTHNDRYELHRDNFIENLQNYLFGKTGISIHAGDNGQHIIYARVDTIDPGLVNAQTHVYTFMRDNTNVYMQSQGNQFSERDWRRIRDILRTGAYDSPVWDHTHFRMHRDLIEELRTLLANIGNVSIGNWEDYKNPARISSSHGGLRVATHDDLTGTSMSAVARAGRQSHHIPQYLLVQYFRNTGETQPSHQKGGHFLPGFSGSGRTINRFEGPGTINLESLDSTAGRGGGIPAISLAARTHQRGRLHINAAFRWPQPLNEDSDRDSFEWVGSITQRHTVDRFFFDRFRAHSRITASDTTALVVEARRHPDRNKPHVYQAIRDTYRWMYNMMINALRHALPEHEIDFYEIAAKALPNTTDASGNLKPEFRPNARDLNAVVAAIEGKNNEIMRNWK